MQNKWEFGDGYCQSNQYLQTSQKRHYFVTKGCTDYTQEHHESRVIKLSENTTTGLQLFSDTSSNLVNQYLQMSRDPKALQIDTEEAEIQCKSFLKRCGQAPHLTQVNTHPEWLFRVIRENQQRGFRKFGTTLWEVSVCCPISTWILHLSCHWYPLLNTQATQEKLWAGYSYKMGNFHQPGHVTFIARTQTRRTQWS